MRNIENNCKNFKNEGIFIFFAKSSLQNKNRIGGNFSSEGCTFG